MMLKGTENCIGLSTYLTNIGFLASVSSFMYFKIKRMNKGFPTMLMNIKFFSTMNPFVIVKGNATTDSFIT
jgi:hypothetical protein